MIVAGRYAYNGDLDGATCYRHLTHMLKFRVRVICARIYGIAVGTYIKLQVQGSVRRAVENLD
jgi:hypothetical protein